MRESVTLKRDELYEQVWAEPTILLATRYGITGTGLAKICRKSSIPVPPRGYWQRPLWSPRESAVGLVGRSAEAERAHRHCVLRTGWASRPRGPGGYCRRRRLRGV